MMLLFAICMFFAKSHAQQQVLFDKLKVYESVLSETGKAYEPIVAADADAVLGRCVARFPCGTDSSSSNPANPFNFSSENIGSAIESSFTQVLLPSDTTLNKIAGCRVAEMEPTWKKHLHGNGDPSAAAVPVGDLYYQYYAGSDNVFGTFPQVPWQCNVPYVPTLRPYYVSATTGPKDLVIIIDVSAAQTRLEDAKTAANALLDTLSFYDYVAIVVLGSFANTSLTPVPQRATISRVNELKDKVSKLTTVTDAVSPDTVDGVRAAVQLLITGENDVSKCTQTVLLITSGQQRFASTIPLVDVLKPYTGLIFFGLIIEVQGNNEQSDTKQILQAACQQHGLVGTSKSSSDILKSLQFYPSYFAAMKQGSTLVRWSEVYEDAFGQGLILSAS